MSHPDRLPLHVALLLIAACGGGADERAGDTAAADADSAPARAAERVGSIEGFDTPESVKYDADGDVYFVSNIAGSPGGKDGNGYIARIAAGDSARTVTRAIVGGRGGVTLHAPKGMEIVGDTLWVADIDVLRGFNKRTGAPVATIQFPRPVHFLNDVAHGPDGALYVTDTGVQFDASGGMTRPIRGQIFRVEGREVTVAASDSALDGPNGIVWDDDRQAFLVVSFPGTAILSWAPGSGAPRPIATGAGQFDGVEVVEGRALVSSWADSTIQVLERGASSPTRLVGGVEAPADIGVDTRRSLLLVPLFAANRVELWSIPTGVGRGTGQAPAD